MRKQLDDRKFERLFRTPQNVNLATLAAAYGWMHIPVGSEAELAKALTTGGRVVIEVSL